MYSEPKYLSWSFSSKLELNWQKSVQIPGFFWSKHRKSFQCTFPRKSLGKSISSFLMSSSRNYGRSFWKIHFLWSYPVKCARQAIFIQPINVFINYVTLEDNSAIIWQFFKFLFRRNHLYLILWQVSTDERNSRKILSKP